MSARARSLRALVPGVVSFWQAASVAPCRGDNGPEIGE
jgi:hypothetical protein